MGRWRACLNKYDNGDWHRKKTNTDPCGHFQRIKGWFYQIQCLDEKKKTKKTHRS